MTDERTLAAENAPMLAGWAMNPNAPVEQRLAAGKQALDFYVAQADKLHELLEHFEAMRDRDMSDHELIHSKAAYIDAAAQLELILDGHPAGLLFGTRCLVCKSARLKAGACMDCGTIQIRRRPETVPPGS